MDRNNPAEVNRYWSAATQASMEAKLNRRLTREESDKIWNTGSFHGLEMIDMAIHYAKSPADLEAYLANLSVLDPIPEEYTRRFDDPEGNPVPRSADSN